MVKKICGPVEKGTFERIFVPEGGGMLTHRSLLSMGNVLVLYFNLFILDDDGDPPVDVQLCLSSYFAADRPLLLAYEGLRSIFRDQTFFLARCEGCKIIGLKVSYHRTNDNRN